MKILDLIYFWSDSEQRSSYWDQYNGFCLFWGFLVLVLVSCFASAWFYFPFTLKDATRALRKNWIKIGFIGAIIFFIVVEIVLSSLSKLPDNKGFIGEGGDIIGFSIINTLFYFPIMYILWSWIFKKFSRNAAFIPWVGLKNKKNNE